ncbi:hypothetical protein [Nocardiopsis sp. NRRL B-16309]|uniref:hypothetical protein n=1 Tax=Nocardiopsis sp. NRRL B-16309 TaxID=1519494 RepID=UPI0006AFB587|nr:hypothetical protein [Nocardiopsis sp. NRRL B-16309]KOX18315.1 hypothetical protein ADL05_07670 [Nocardiopsis sp. NRRL B-16309]
MIPVFIAFIGLVLLGLAAGFFLAISIGIRRQDNRGRYRSLREEDDNSALSRTGSLVVGLRFANGTATERRDRTPGPAGTRDPLQERTPSAV